MPKVYATIWPANWPPQNDLVLEFEAQDVVEGVARAQAFVCGALAFSGDITLVKSVDLRKPRGKVCYEVPGDKFSRELLAEAVVRKGHPGP